MNKKIPILIAAVILIGAGLFLMRNRGEDETLTGEESLPLSAQQHLMDMFGVPDQFAVMYLPQEDLGDLVLVRSEVWFYPQLGKKVTFIGGNISNVEEYTPEIEGGPTKSGLNPGDFHYDMTMDDIKSIFGEDNVEAVDYLPGLYEEGQLETYITDKALFIFEQGKLTYFQTFGLGEEKPQEEADVTGFWESLILPQRAYARISLRKAFRSLGKAVKFIIRLPDKATRWMGPVIGPVVSMILTKNIIKHPKFGPIFGKAKRIDRVLSDINEQQELVAELKNAYKEQASALTKMADELQQSREDLKRDLLSGDVTFDEYKENVIAIDEMVKAFQNGADKFNRESNNVNVGSIAKMLGKDLLNKVLGQAKEIVINQIGGEIKKLIDPKVIDFLVSQDKQGFDAVLDLVLAGDLEQLLRSGDYEGIDVQELKDRIREEFKQMIQENKEDLKANWKQLMKDAADKIKLQLEEEASEYQAEEEEHGEEGEGGYDEEIPVCDRTPKPTSDKCPSGYEFDPRSGVGCVQANCYDEAIKYAHWDYTGRCVCGTSGSPDEKPTDPNKECSLPSGCAYCPGCVYACVTFDEDCPDFSSSGFSIEE